MIIALAAIWAANTPAYAARPLPACDRTKGYFEARRLFAETKRLMKAEAYQASLMASHHAIVTLHDDKSYAPPGLMIENENIMMESHIAARDGDLRTAAQIAADVLGQDLHMCKMISHRKRR